MAGRQGPGRGSGYLWPPPGVEPASGEAVTHEIAAAYPHRAAVPPASWWHHLTHAQERIDLLGYAVLHLPEQHPQLMELLEDKARASCRVRIALADPDSQPARQRDEEEQLDGGLLARIRTSTKYFGELLDVPRVELRQHATPMYNSTFRFDDHMFVTPHLHGVRGASAPLLHLRRRGPEGVFAKFALTSTRRHLGDLDADHGDLMARTEYVDDPNAPEPTSIVPAASAVVVDDQERVLLHRRTDNDLWSIPGGRIELGESVAQTAVREVEEETGLQVEPVRLIGVYSDPRHVVAYSDGEVRQQFSICVACRIVGGDLSSGSEESADVGLFTRGEIADLSMSEAIRLRIDDFFDAEPQAVLR